MEIMFRGVYPDQIHFHLGEMGDGMGSVFSSNDYVKRIENEMAKLELPFDQFKAIEIKGTHSIVD